MENLLRRRPSVQSRSGSHRSTKGHSRFLDTGSGESDKGEARSSLRACRR
ncbi:hypothetical protein [Lysobacter gummosus]